MSTSKHFDKICIIVIILAMLGTLFFMNGEAFGLTRVVDADAEANSDLVWFTENDQNAAWSTEKATIIALEGDKASVSGQGAYAYNGSVYISNAGKYVISGTLTDGSIVVDAEDASKVWILLDGAQISCADDACIRVDQADKVFLTLAEGSENTLASGADYSEEALADGTGGVIYAHDDLTINGSGTLAITAAYKHGIEANDDLVITGGTITIEAPGDGIHVNDSLRMMGTDLHITAGDDGIDLDGSDEKEAGAECGYLYVESGIYEISSEDDGIHTAGDITISGGTLTIASGDDGIHSDTAFDMADGAILITDCYEGIEAITINIAGGDVTVYPEDDGLNANGNSGMDMGMGNRGAGMRGQWNADMQDGGPGGMQMPGGENQSEMPEMPQPGEEREMSEMPEPGENGEMPEMLGPSENGEMSEMRQPGEEGEMPEMPEPGEEGEMSEMPEPLENGEMPEMPQTGEDGETENATDPEEETWIRISGGSVTVINENGRDADGLDSNGDIYITGGTVRVSLEGSDGSNSAIDYGSENGGVCEVSGGTIVACGGSYMAEGFDSESTQVGILYNLDSTMEAGTQIQVLDENGETVLSYTAECAFNSVALSCPELEVGRTYTIAVGDITEEVTPDSTAVTVGTAGMEMGGFRGGMQPGGMNSSGQNSDMGGMRHRGDSLANNRMMQKPESGEIPKGGDMQGQPQMVEDGDMPDAPERGDDEVFQQMKNGTMTEAADSADMQQN